MKNRILKTMLACAISMGSVQETRSMESIKQASSAAFGLHPLLIVTGTASLGVSLGALYMINKKAKQLEEANGQKPASEQSNKPAIFKHGLRAGVISAVGIILLASENYLHDVAYEIPTHKIALFGRCGVSLGLGLGLLKASDTISDWSVRKLDNFKYKAHAKNIIKVAGYLAGLYIGGIALVDSYGFAR